MLWWTWFALWILSLVVIGWLWFYVGKNPHSSVDTVSRIWLVIFILTLAVDGGAFLEMRDSNEQEALFTRILVFFGWAAVNSVVGRFGFVMGMKNIKESKIN